MPLTSYAAASHTLDLLSAQELSKPRFELYPYHEGSPLGMPGDRWNSIRRPRLSQSEDSTEARVELTRMGGRPAAVRASRHLVADPHLDRAEKALFRTGPRTFLPDYDDNRLASVCRDFASTVCIKLIS
jgi:hypothetical protein